MTESPTGPVAGPLDEDAFEEPDPRDSDQPIPDIKPHQGLYWILQGLTVAAYGILTLIGMMLWHSVYLDIGVKFSYGPLLLIPVGLHIYLSFMGNTVAADQIAGYYFYEYPLKKAGTGPKFASFGLIQVIKENGDQQQIFAPGKADDIFWGDEEEPLPSGMVRPIFIPTRPPLDPEKDPLDAQMSVGVVYYVLWRVTNIFNFRARVRSIPEGESLLRSVSRRSLRELIVKYTAGGAIKDQETINANFDNRIRRRARNLGISIDDAGIEDINTTHELGSAMRDRASARFKAETRVIAANAEAEEVERLGRAKGVALEAETAGPLKGRAAGLQAIAAVAKTPEGALALASETAVRIAENTEVIMAGAAGGMTDIMAMTTAVKKSLGAGGGDAKAS